MFRLFGIPPSILFLLLPLLSSLFLFPALDYGPPSYLLLLILKWLVEVLAAYYALFYLVVGFLFFTISQSHRPTFNCFASTHCSRHYDKLAVAYLCCDDADPMAFKSIVDACGRHRIPLYIHDDSSAESERLRVDEMVAAFSATTPCALSLIRRLDRTGGKPGAVNSLLTRLPASTEYLFLRDNDCYLYSSKVFCIVAFLVRDQRIAIAQCRNVGHIQGDEPKTFQALSLATDFYDLFVRAMTSLGWPPFLGHNAILRVSTLRAFGGLTPNELADDIDYAVRLRLAGYKILYIPDVVCGERHPLNYSALRTRTAKWAYGCTSVLIRYWLAVAHAGTIRGSGKIAFFMTVGFYPFQACLLLYVVIFYVVLPWWDCWLPSALELCIYSGGILFLVFFPSIAYFFCNGRLAEWPRAAFCWTLAYGSTDFVVTRSVIWKLAGRPLRWTPTNCVVHNTIERHWHPEVLVGVVMAVVVCAKLPSLLFLPTTFVFVGKFFLTPFVDRVVFRMNQRQCVDK